MRYFLITSFLLLIFNLPVRATDASSELRLRIDSLHYYASVYDTMNPLSQNQQHLEMLYDYQQRIKAILLEVLNNQHYFKLQPSKLIHTPAIAHTKSADDRIHIFCIDEKTGGSFRSNISIIHFVEEKYCTARLLPDQFVPHYFSAIHKVDSATYLAMGSVISCNTCTSLVAMQVFIGFRAEWQYETVASVDCRWNHLIDFSFNDSTHVITYDFATRSDDSMFGEVSGNRDEEGHQPWMVRESGEYTWRNGKFRETARCTSTELIEW